MAEMALPASVPTAEAAAPADPSEPSFAVAITPVVAVIALNFVFAEWLIPALDTSFLAQPRYGAVSLGAVAGLWAIVLAVAVSSISRHPAQPPAFCGPPGHRQSGHLGLDAADAERRLRGRLRQCRRLAACLRDDTQWADRCRIRPGVVNLHHRQRARGLTGSASGGLSIALASLGDFFVEQARAAGVSLEVMHRAAAIASGGMDLLPHNGAVITLLAICGLTHRQSYLDILAISVIATLSGVVMLLIYNAVGAF